MTTCLSMRDLHKNLTNNHNLQGIVKDGGTQNLGVLIKHGDEIMDHYSMSNNTLVITDCGGSDPAKIFICVIKRSSGSFNNLLCIIVLHLNHLC